MKTVFALAVTILMPPLLAARVVCSMKWGCSAKGTSCFVETKQYVKPRLGGPLKEENHACTPSSERACRSLSRLCSCRLLSCCFSAKHTEVPSCSSAKLAEWLSPGSALPRRLRARPRIVFPPSTAGLQPYTVTTSFTYRLSPLFLKGKHLPTFLSWRLLAAFDYTSIQ